MYTPKNPHIPDTPTKKLKMLSALSFAAVFVLGIVVIVLSLLLITEYHRIASKQQDIELLTSTLEKATDQVTATKRQLIVDGLLPPLDSFTQQCPGGNVTDALFTPLNKTPVEGYNIFLVDCRSNLGTGKSDPRVLVFRVNNDGSKEFTYGASTTEPLCISNKIPIANKLSAKLQLPVCATN